MLMEMKCITLNLSHIEIYHISKKCVIFLYKFSDLISFISQVKIDARL